MSELTVNEKFFRLKNDSKKQWNYIIKLQQQLVATQSFQYILMANLREFMPPFHSKIVDGLEEVLESIEAKESRKPGVSPFLSEYFQILSDAECATLSEFHKKLSQIKESEPPPDDDLYQ
jgi:hypothetical protein